MKLSCQEGMVPGKSLAEKFAKLEQYGYDGVEIGGTRLARRSKEIAKLAAKYCFKFSCGRRLGRN